MPRESNTGVKGLTKISKGKHAGRFRLDLRWTHDGREHVYTKLLDANVTKKGATKFARDAWADAFAGKPLARDERKLLAGVTVEELADDVIKHRKADGGSPATLFEFENVTRNHVVPFFGETAPSAIDSAKLLAFRDHLGEKAPRTIRNIFKVLGVFVRIALARKLDPALTSNPVRAAMADRLVPLPKAKDPPVVFLPRAEAEKLLACKAIPFDRRVRYAVAFLTGLRDGELAGLTWGDVEPDGKTPTLAVRGAIAIRGDGTKGDAKTRDSRRVVPLHRALVPWLRAHKPERAAAGAFVFPSGRAWHAAEDFRTDLETAKCATKHEGQPITFHATRRSFATWAEEAGVFPETIDRLLGHAGKSTRTKHYSAPMLNALREAIDRIPLRLPKPPKEA